jgi:hypothetical protein
MSLPSDPVNGKDELHENWLGWVTTNLGRDADLAEIAAKAATDEIKHGGGFNGAVEAARAAWTEAALVKSARASAIELEHIDPARTERRAVIALGFGIAALVLPILTVLVLLAIRWYLWPSDAAFGGVWLAVVDTALIPGSALVAVLFGHRARRRINQYGLPGNRYAVAGLILGYCALVGSPLFVGLVWVVMFLALFCCYF